MCVDKDRFEELARAVSEVNSDTVSIRKDVRTVKTTLREQNSRIKTSENNHVDTKHRLDNLEDPIRKGAYCVQAETIVEMKNDMLTTEKFEDYLANQKKDKHDEELLKNQKTRWIVGIVGVGVALVQILVGIMLYVFQNSGQ